MCLFKSSVFFVWRCVSTADSESSMLQAVQSDDTNGIQVVVVHNLELLPHYWSGLTLQQTETLKTKNHRYN